MARPATLTKDVSPPPSRKASSAQKQTVLLERKHSDRKKSTTAHELAPTLAAIEAGEARIRDHLAYFARHLADATRVARGPRLSIEDFQDLYRRNQHDHGCHFVVHQHDHPISGMLTLGISRQESASHATGSLLIWDTGEYEVLPRKETRAPATDDELSDADSTLSTGRRSQNELLSAAFQSRHIRLRLHGTRLPRGYTVSLRLPSNNDRSDQPKRPKRKRRRIDPAMVSKRAGSTVIDSDMEDEPTPVEQNETLGQQIEDAAANASDDDEDTTIRVNNAYPGANNTIGSIHQRNWFLRLDPSNSGLRKTKGGPKEGRWIGSWDAFFVLGRDHERSLVTGRSADEVMEDEGVEKFLGRKMWRPITE
ncbi:hypothetical protein LTR37_010320 [Vermiconidia calcicola]|uniref:Uncharacterized protein n=1 Tax=Vermiconidia calcicola TaxID=1690605 RepID=A0ACC3N5F1_9PEZI|nr:hypothetical protein LTR37_010320 [Vermiconidia calcicola]